MRIETIEKTVYSHDDLLLKENEDLKQKVLEKMFNINTDYNWYEPIYEGFKEHMKNHGVDVSNIYFSGFYSQGDGAIFEVNRLDIIEFLKANKLLTKFKDLANEIKKRIAENYYNLPLYKLKSIYQFIGHDDIVFIKHSGRYYHEKSYTLDFNYCYDNVDDFENYLRDFIESKSKQLYKDLENYYDELQSEECILETIQANNYEFDENGKII